MLQSSTEGICVNHLHGQIPHSNWWTAACGDVSRVKVTHAHFITRNTPAVSVQHPNETTFILNYDTQGSTLLSIALWNQCSNIKYILVSKNNDLMRRLYVKNLHKLHIWLLAQFSNMLYGLLFRTSWSDHNPQGRLECHSDSHVSWKTGWRAVQQEGVSNHQTEL